MAESTCVVEGCDRAGRKRRMCSKHYLRWWRASGGSPPKFIGRECQSQDCGEAAGKHSGFCRKCYLRNYDQANRQRISERKARARTPESRRLAAAKARGYRAANPDRHRKAHARFKAKHPERVRGVQERYRKSPVGTLKNREKGRRRRARFRDAHVEIVDYAAILAEHGMFCHICSMVIVDMSDLHLDHVVPLALGGLHVASNIRPAHALCNLRKGAKAA